METKNILRQNFIHEDVGRNKAEVLTERYSGLYSNVTLSHIPKYATWEKYDRLKDIKRTAQEMEQYIDLDAINLEENSSIISFPLSLIAPISIILSLKGSSPVVSISKTT